jgi:hypothetical protein
VNSAFARSLIVCAGTALIAFSLLSASAATSIEAVHPAVQVAALSSPAPVGSQLSRLTRDGDGHIYLSWVVVDEGAARLEYARLIGEQWSEAHVISDGEDWFINWADFPVLSVGDGSMVAHWLKRSDKGRYDYDIIARFFDASPDAPGESLLVNRDGVSAEHGFVSMLPMADRTLLAWLDGRNTRLDPEPGPMTLRAAVFDAAGKRLREWQLDDRVCDCCQTSVAMTAEGPVVVYRDRSPDEIRDTAIVRWTGDDWSAPVIVGRDNWQVTGCPVNGPAVVASGKSVAVAWFSARNDVPRVSMALSSDGGRSFGPPVSVGGASAIGRLDAAMLANGDIVISWVDADADTSEARIMLSRLDAHGALVDTVSVAPTNSSRRSGFPSIESVGNEVTVSWTDVVAKRVRLARVSYR